MLRFVCAVLAAALLLVGTQYRVQATETLPVRVTYYLPTGNPTYSGVYPYVGSVACSWNIPLYSVLELPDGWQVVCLDRGQLGSTGWVDVFVPSHEAGREWVAGTYGSHAEIRVLRWGRGD